MAELLLDVKGLFATFHTADGAVPAVSDVSLQVHKGEVVAIVGESGSGKTVTALSIMRLIHTPPGEIRAQRLVFDGMDLTTLSAHEVRRVRGNAMSMIFQEPMTSLNPVMTVGLQVAESLEIHRGMSRPAAMKAAIEMLRLVGIPVPEQRVREYPHQLSGGMRQRVMIAIALACRPQLLIADEPTTALDVTIQAQILDLIRRLKQELGMAVVLITHDIGVVREMADRVTVMYAGQVVEEGPSAAVFGDPLHPYTEGLLRSIPTIERKVKVLNVIKGVIPSPMFFPKGCRFNPRCRFATPKCVAEVPSVRDWEGGRSVRCWYPLAGEGERAGD